MSESEIGSGSTPSLSEVLASLRAKWELGKQNGSDDARRHLEAIGRVATQRSTADNTRVGLENTLYELLAANGVAREVTALLAEYFPNDPWEPLLLAAGLLEKPFDGFGHPPYVPVGMGFPNRRALRAAGVHAHLQGGIWGKASEEAKSIVVSGGYEDDEDYGDEIIYTGQGGQDQATKRQVKDQVLTLGNAALVNSIATGRPVRVIRGSSGDRDHSPSEGLRYDGLYRVEKHWSQRGTSGFLVWRYQLRAVASTDSIDRNAATNAAKLSRSPRKIPAAAPTLGSQPTGNDTPDRKKGETQRIIRSTAVANWVKKIHNHTCQVCGTRIETPTGAYAEAAHVRPLGRPHNGPDTTDNVLCLCPNHHVEFDFGMITINADGTVLERGSRQHGYKLRQHSEHPINAEHLKHHRDHHESQKAAGTD
ncbi:YDG/SRA domain-containing protein [Streptomyces aureoversilis]|uniref:YDG/SRA domain-containing protein n=1 Tax=Streptomyces aureoversilis TaxID=67277 RepID=A0ABW0A4T2_9ACTN